MFAVPSGITEIEKRALEDAAQSAGAGDVFLIEAPMSAAIGAGLPVSEPEGCMLMDIGASETEMVVISLAGIVHSNVLRVGGNEMNSAIMTYLRDKYSLVIGEREAEDIKIKIGTACRSEKELEYEIKGIDATNSIIFQSTARNNEEDEMKKIRVGALCLVASFALGISAVITGAGCKKCKPAEAALSERAPDAAGGAGSSTSLGAVGWRQIWYNVRKGET